MKRFMAGAALLLAVMTPVVVSAPAHAIGHCLSGFVLVQQPVNITAPGSGNPPSSASYVAHEHGGFFGAGEWMLQIKHGDEVRTIVGHPDSPSDGLPDAPGYGDIYAGDEVTGWVYDPVSVLYAGPLLARVPPGGLC